MSLCTGKLGITRMWLPSLVRFISTPIVYSWRLSFKLCQKFLSWDLHKQVLRKIFLFWRTGPVWWLLTHVCELCLVSLHGFPLDGHIQDRHGCVMYSRNHGQLITGSFQDVITHHQNTPATVPLVYRVNKSQIWSNWYIHVNILRLEHI